MTVVCGIYLLRNQVTGKVYVGQSKNCHLRFRQHRNRAHHERGQSALYGSIRKYGFEAFTMEIIEVFDGASQDAMDARETHWIKHYNACDMKHGYNIMPGGQGSAVVGPDARARIAAKLRGRKQSPEQIEKNRQAHIGLACTEAAKEKHREFHLGKSLGKEAAEQIKAEVNALFPMPKKLPPFGKPMSQEARERTSARFKGKPKSEETRRRMSEARKTANPEAEARRIAVLRAVTQARWAKYRAEKTIGAAA